MPPAAAVITAGAIIHDAARQYTQRQSPAGNTCYTWDAAGRMSVSEPGAGVLPTEV